MAFSLLGDKNSFFAKKMNQTSGYQTPEIDYGSSESEEKARQSLDSAQNYQTNLAKQARTYRQNLGSTQGALMNQASDVGKRNLAQSMAQSKASASSRGFLNSGLMQGAQSANYANYLGNLSNARAGINQETESNALAMEDQAKKAGLQLQAQRQALEDAIYRRKLQQYNQAMGEREQGRADTQAISSSLGGFLGALGGR